MGKYAALRDRLERGSGPIELTFDEIAALVGGLPPSAYRHSAWWSNNEARHVQTEGWLGARRMVTRLDLAGKRVWFSDRER